MAENQNHVLIVLQGPPISAVLDRLLRSAGFNVTIVEDGAGAIRLSQMTGASIVLVGERLRDGLGIDFAGEFARRTPSLPVIFFAEQNSPELQRRAMKQGVADFLCPPFRSSEVLQAVRDALDLAKRRKDSLLLEARRFTSSLQRQVDELDTLTRLGRQVTSSLNLDSVLASIVDAAVQLTGAEEGSLLLIDETTGDLYMRASRNFQEDFVRTFRLPITDSLAGQVIRTGEAVLFDKNAPDKIKTAYLVQSLLYVPLSLHGHVFGVLGVDNRHSHLPLTQYHVNLLNALSGYAVIALENARLYADVTSERNKLETILTGTQDGVMVVDQDQRLGLINQAARDAFGIDGSANLSGKPFHDVFPQEEVRALATASDSSLSNRAEISPDESRIFSIQVTPISGVGRVFTMHDITYLKKLDRIKTDFVNTVSHDLRSPLTSILGYVELIERAGPVTALQHDFIHRVQASVHNITSLVDDLLDLGRIESGFDMRKENVQLEQVIRYSAEGMKKKLAERNLHLQISFPQDFPEILSNPVQMRQMTDHLLENAVKYSTAGSIITISGHIEQNQLILQFSNTGIGIPTIDLPYIFDRFYRAANASAEMPGTGLGLAIVKTVVENHGGRIWVESSVGKGAVFTIVLPLQQAGLPEPKTAAA